MLTVELLPSVGRRLSFCLLVHPTVLSTSLSQSSLLSSLLLLLLLSTTPLLAGVTFCRIFMMASVLGFQQWVPLQGFLLTSSQVPCSPSHITARDGPNPKVKEWQVWVDEDEDGHAWLSETVQTWLWRTMLNDTGVRRALKTRGAENTGYRAEGSLM